jgi:hypothetical protein
MNTYTHLLSQFGSLKNCAANAAHCRGSVGRRVATRKALLLRFLIATTVSRVFQQSISDHQCPSVVKNLIRKISVHSRSFAVFKTNLYGPT